MKSKKFMTVHINLKNLSLEEGYSKFQTIKHNN